MANGTTNVSFSQPTDYATEMTDISRKRKLAEALQVQGMTPDSGTQMVGGWAIPKSPMENFGKLAQSLSGAYQQKQLTDQEKTLADSVRTQNNTDAQGFTQALTGTPEQPAIDQPSEEVGGGPSRPVMPAVAPDRQRALAIALGSQNPALQSAGGSIMAQMLKPKEIKAYKPGDVLYQDGTQVGAIPAKPTEHVIDGKVYSSGPNGLSEVGGPGVQEQWTEPYQLGGQTVQKNTRTGQVRQAVTLPPQIRNTTTVNNSGPKAFETELGKLDAEQLGKWRDNAQSAQQTLGIVQNLRASVDQGVYSGGAAQAKTAVANMINGITGATPKSLPGSQLFNAEASKLVLEKIKTLGANPSNADREFIEKTVPQLSTSPQARDALINFMEQRANQSIDLYQRADTHARANHGLGGFSPLTQAPAGNGGTTPARRASDKQKLKFDANGNQVNG